MTGGEGPSLPTECPACGSPARWEHREVDVALPLASDPPGSVRGVRRALIAHAPHCGHCGHQLLVFREIA